MDILWMNTAPYGKHLRIYNRNHKIVISQNRVTHQWKWQIFYMGKQPVPSTRLINHNRAGDFKTGLLAMLDVLKIYRERYEVKA